VQLNRRSLLTQSGIGLGKIALAALLSGSMRQSVQARSELDGPFDVQPAHFARRAKAVIHLFMAGGPSHLELFDYKPQLAKYEGKPIPPEVIGGQRYAFIRSDAAALGPRFKFARHGQCGAEISEALPHLAGVVDDICLVRSVHTDQFNHAPAQIFLNTGFSQPGRPSMGSWVTYGLGAETRDLPAFVVMSTGSGISGGAANWSSGFLPTVYAGVRLRNQGDAILNVSSPAGIDRRTERETLDLVGQLNRQRMELINDPEIATRIASYEMAYRLQSSAPELTDLARESRATLELYGADPAKPSFARACLLARRMVERGVRFVSIYHEGWDAHSDVVGNHKKNCGDTDQASAALVKDLRQRGLLDETLVIWGGEFGRTPTVELPKEGSNQGKINGRDHNHHGFTMWLAGGGVKGGYVHGATDEFGFKAVENRVHVHDLHATLLKLLGFDHEKFTYRYAGRDFRLTDVYGKVVNELIA
jgi:uncharacterized protein (DUF1501 family)